MWLNRFAKLVNVNMYTFCGRRDIWCNLITVTSVWNTGETGDIYSYKQRITGKWHGCHFKNA